jgi:hypothetical protein
VVREPRYVLPTFSSCRWQHLKDEQTENSAIPKATCVAYVDVSNHNDLIDTLLLAYARDAGFLDDLT